MDDGAERVQARLSRVVEKLDLSDIAASSVVLRVHAFIEKISSAVHVTAR